MNKTTILVGDSRELLRGLADNSQAAVVTDPPYELGFMNKGWDSTGIAYDVSLWKEVLRVLKPGGHLLAFSGTRTYHRMACALEGFDFIGMELDPEYAAIAEARIAYAAKAGSEVVTTDAPFAPKEASTRTVGGQMGLFD